MDNENQGRVWRKLKTFSLVRFCEGPWKDCRKVVFSEWIVSVELTEEMVLHSLVGRRVAIRYPDPYEPQAITEARVMELQPHESRWKSNHAMIILETNDYYYAKLLSQNIKEEFKESVSITCTHKNLPSIVPKYQRNTNESKHLLPVVDISDAETRENPQQTPNNNLEDSTRNITLQNKISNTTGWPDAINETHLTDCEDIIFRNIIEKNNNQIICNLDHDFSTINAERQTGDEIQASTSEIAGGKRKHNKTEDSAIQKNEENEKKRMKKQRNQHLLINPINSVAKLAIALKNVSKLFFLFLTQQEQDKIKSD